MLPLVAALLFPFLCPEPTPPPPAAIVVENGDAACGQFRICSAGVPIRFRVHHLDMSGWDPDGACDTFEWTFADDGSTSNEHEPVHTFTEPGWQLASLRIMNEAGWTYASVWINGNTEPYKQWGLIVTPWETTIAPGETTTITATKRWPNPGIFHISCHGAIECERATIGMSENEARVVVRGVSEGVGGLFYIAASFGTPRSGGPFGAVLVQRARARSRAVRK